MCVSSSDIVRGSLTKLTRDNQPSQQLSQIEKSVTHLLIATKQLLETLTQWSRHTATEAEVSDVYVRLGYEFNIACRAFTAIGVETADLGPVPDLLRSILEDTLSQEASPASLDKFLPRIRDIIINLLHGLKRKQQRLRSRQAKETGSGSGSFAARQGSSGSTGSAETGITQLLEDTPSQRQNSTSADRRHGSGGSIPIGGDNGVPPRSSSVQNGGTALTRQDSGNNRVPNDGRNPNRDTEQSFPTSNSGSSLSSNTMQNIPVLAPFPEADNTLSQRQRPPPNTSVPLPPPPQPRQQDALAALQRGPDLERRASRRYSAYQISKHLGASPNGVPMLPPAQNSPVPNRGRDVRESLNAVRTRGSTLHSRQRSNNRLADSSPTRSKTVSRRISEESSQSSEAPTIKPPAEPQPYDSPTTKTPDDKVRQPYVDLNGNDKPILGATLSGPPVNEVEGIYDTTDEELGPQKPSSGDNTSRLPSFASLSRVDQPLSSGETQPQQFIPEQSPQPGKELTLFLQYKSRIKKFVLNEGLSDLSIARLQLAFIEKFAWNTHSNGNDLPEIYIQDPVSGVRHELEDLADVKDRSVLVLNVEVLDEVKKHIDEGLGGLRRMVEGVRAVVDGQQSAIQRVADKQQETAKDMARLSTAPSPPAIRTNSAKTTRSSGTRSSTSPIATSQQLSEIKSLRRDLAVVRQTYSTFVSDINASMSEVRTKASSVKTVALDTAIPSLDSSTGRAYVNAGKKTLGAESEKIVNRVDDLQDLVEDLRKDVVSRGVRPLPRQLETVSKDISIATAELKKMQEYLKREKPVWTKIWEKELELVCTDRDLLTMQEELAADLEDDLEKATQTFALVEQATKQQSLGSSQGTGVQLRSTSRGLSTTGVDQDVDPMKAKDGVLGEVRALQPNHETRLEAIERAEKLRQKELEERRDGEFKKELGSFVEEGKLKKSGGVEEAERLRKAKDERNRRTAWETQQERAAGKGKEVDTSAAEQVEETATPDEGTDPPEPDFVEAQEQPGAESGTQPPDGGEQI